jgi:putative ABC transport system permease protein
VKTQSIAVSAGLAWRQLRREFRLPEYLVLLFALVLSVAAVTSVGFFANRVERAMSAQAATLLAADAVVSSPQVITDDLTSLAERNALNTTLVTEFPSVVLSEAGDTALVSVKSVGDAYPLRGEVRLSDALYAADFAAAAVPGSGQIWIDPRLAGSLQVETGDRLALGELEMEVAALISFEPDRSGDVFQMAPRVIMSNIDLPASGLLGDGSRARYRLLVAGEETSVEQFGNQVDSLDDTNLRYQNVEQGRPAVRSALVNVRKFLGLAAAVAVLLSGAAVALAARQIAERDMDTSAVMRAMGASSKTVVRMVLIRLALIALLAAAIGSAIGFIAQFTLAALLARWFVTELPAPTLYPLVGGISCAVLALVGFCLPAITRAVDAPVVRVFRRDLPLTRPSVRFMIISGLAAMLLLLWWLTRDALLGALLIGATVTVAGLLWLISRGLIAVGNRVRSPALRRALEALRRRPNSVSVQVAAYSVGLLALLLLAIVRTDVLNTWQQQIPEDAPNFFMVNVQPQEVESVESFLQDRAVTGATLYPMIRGRLQAINETPIGQAGYRNEQAQRMSERDFNLSYLAAARDDNKVVAGEWWPEDTEESLFSVEEGFAEETGIELGDTLHFKIADKTVSGVVSNLREVQWESFAVNFFVVGSPAALQDKPASFISSLYVAENESGFVRDIVRDYPGVTVLEIGSMIERVTGILSRAALAVQYVFSFTLLAGVLVLIAAVLASRRERFHETAILRTLGASRAYLARSMSREFLMIGLLAGFIASSVASLLAWLVIERVMRLEYEFNAVLYIVGVLAGVLGIWIAGLIISRPVLKQSPVSVIRSQM